MHDLHLKSSKMYVNTYKSTFKCNVYQCMPQNDAEWRNNKRKYMPNLQSGQNFIGSIRQILGSINFTCVRAMCIDALKPSFYQETLISY